MIAVWSPSRVATSRSARAIRSPAWPRRLRDPASDRMGARLSGPRIVAREGEILTCGVVAGAVQVPSAGAPIVLLADHQATGGYPVIATVIAADLGLVAQRVPGERLRFVRVDRDRAVVALRDVRDALAEIA